MDLCSEQLIFLLKRKYEGIKIGKHVVIEETATNKRDPYGEPIPAYDAYIAEWNLKKTPKPSDDEIMRIWNIIKDEYHGSESFYHSDLSKFIRDRTLKRFEDQINVKEGL